MQSEYTPLLNDTQHFCDDICSRLCGKNSLYILCFDSASVARSSSSGKTPSRRGRRPRSTMIWWSCVRRRQRRPVMSRPPREGRRTRPPSQARLLPPRPPRSKHKQPIYSIRIKACSGTALLAPPIHKGLAPLSICTLSIRRQVQMNLKFRYVERERLFDACR